jgi:succinyl-diaminopimelate desuccinylase
MDLAESLLWLCSIPSLIGEERALCDAVVERLSRCSLAAPIRRYGDSIVVPLIRGKSGSHLVLGGHLDVVRTEHTKPARIEGDRLYGPGAADMKSGLTLMLELAESGIDANVNLSLVFYAREEGPFAENELGVVLAEDAELRGADFALMLEPSDNKLQLGCGGSIHANVVFRGKTAHSARPWQGENAIYGAIGLLSRLRGLQPEKVEVDGLSWMNVVSPTLVSGGRARNIIPDRMELNLNYRFAPTVGVDQVKARLLELVGSTSGHGVGSGPEVSFVDVSPSAPPHRNHPLVVALAESGVLAIEPKQAWTDVARFAELGVPAVNFGPGVQAQAHQRDEWTSLPALDTGRKILRAFLARAT